MSPWSESGRGESMHQTPAHGQGGLVLKNEKSNELGEEKMPSGTWTAKRERQYDHIKSGLRDRGEPENIAEEIAARTVNKERARNGESRESSRTSTDDLSSGRRGGLRSHRGSGGRTRRQLYAEAQRRGIAGRSRMSKAQLERAVDA